MPWLVDAITQVMLEQYHAGIEDPALLAVASLRAVYPTASDGQSLRWPTNPADCAEKRILESRVILRAQRLVAEAFDVRAEELWYREGGT